MDNVDSYYHFRPEFDTWAVFFNNRDKLSPGDVKQIFSKYGPVRKVVQAGTSGAGVCFVNFMSESSARSCVLGMRNRGSIKLRRFNPDELGKSSKTDKSSKKPDSTLQKNNHNKNGDKSDSDFYSSTNSLVSLESGSTVLQKSAEMRESPTAAVSTCAQMPAADVGGSELEKKYVDETREPSNAPDIVTAQEVIVANVHESCGEGFILDLLKDFEPIAATSMKMIPKYNLRYCHIYFMTPQIAQAVESNYDNVKLYDNSLIVLRAENLIGHGLSETATCSV